MTSEARFIVNAIVVPVGVLLPIVSAAFAWFKGGPAERYGAALFCISATGTFAFEILTGISTPVIFELFLDTAVAVGFLGLAIRYNNLWLGAAMMVKGVQLGIHATHLTDGEDPMFLGFNMYAAGLNLISLLICIILISGTAVSARQRAKGHAKAKLAELPLRSPRGGSHALGRG